MTDKKIGLFLTKRDRILLGCLGFFEFIGASVWIILIQKDTTNSFLFGLSKQRLMIVGVSIITAIICLLIGILSSKNDLKYSDLLKKQKRSTTIFFLLFSIFCLLIGLGFIFFQPDLIKSFSAYFIRLRPFGIALGLINFQFWLVLLIRNQQQLSVRIQRPQLDLKPTLILFIILVVYFFISYFTKFGLVCDTPLWNVAGIPISGYQILFSLLFMLAALILEKRIIWFRTINTGAFRQIIIPILVYLIAIMAWGFTPLDHHFFTLRATTGPDFQPYPFSDARYIDLGAISILSGKGILFHQSTDKPLYMVITAIYHLIAGNNYFLIQWLQVAFLGLIPVVAYKLGTKFYSSLFGFLLSFLIIIHQRSAIILSLDVASVNVKLLMSETTTLLGILFIVLFFFKWYQTRDLKYVVLLGGTIGAVSLIRLNPILFFPVLAVLIFILCGRKNGNRFQQVFVFSLGFLLVFMPWFFVGRDVNGQSFFMSKIDATFRLRIAPILDATTSLYEKPTPNESIQISKASGLEPISVVPMNTNVPEQSGENRASNFVYLFAEHFSHNIITSLLILPDSIPFQDINTLSQRTYWQDDEVWDGKLPISQIVFIICNLSILSIGLFQAWKRFKWGGLFPMITFLIYNFALCISLTSGGRYIVPINWIVLFYYVFGILSILEWFLAVSGIREQVSLPIIIQQVDSHKLFSRRMIGAWISILLLASLIPIAGDLIPKFITREQPKDPTQILITNSIEVKENNNYHLGTIYYPYLENDGLSFAFVSQDTFFEIIHISKEKLTDSTLSLKQGSQAILGMDEGQDVKSVFIIQENK